jgi:hypothetical protein
MSGGFWLGDGFPKNLAGAECSQGQMEREARLER